VRRQAHSRSFFLFFFSSRFINVFLINSVCIENDAFQVVSEIKNTLVGHFLNCVCVCACMHMWGVTWHFLVLLHGTVLRTVLE
jgi:peptidoglycan biosynthesis protein MviN/MurJ (putative lipid II flippase)